MSLSFLAGLGVRTKSVRYSATLFENILYIFVTFPCFRNKEAFNNIRDQFFLFPQLSGHVVKKFTPSLYHPHTLSLTHTTMCHFTNTTSPSTILLANIAMMYRALFIVAAFVGLAAAAYDPVKTGKNKDFIFAA